MFLLLLVYLGGVLTIVSPCILPVLPFVFASGWTAVIISVSVSALALFGIGAAITIFTGKSVWFSGTRQLVLGLAAAGLTFGLGHLLGVAIG